jgi:hypothetical protein
VPDQSTADTNRVPVAGWLALAAVVPFSIGAVAGFRIRAGPSYRQAPAVAWICTLVLVGILLFVGSATTPQSACNNTGCDTGYGLGAMFLSLPVFLLALAGVSLGRLMARWRRKQPSTSP